MAALVSPSNLPASLVEQPSSPNNNKPQQQLLSQKLQLHKSPHQNYANNNNNRNIQVFGHRGALYEAVENTLESFQQCMDWQCHGVELDVFLLKDGTLIVFHGSGTDKTPGLLEHYCVADNDKSSILDLTWEQVQQLEFVTRSEHVPAPAERLATAKIPTLRQVLELFQQNTSLQIKMELKGAGTVEPAISLVEELNMQHQVVFSSFDHDRVLQVKQLRPRFRTAAVFPALVPDNFLQRLTEQPALKPDEVHLRYDTCSVDRVAAAHKAGFQVMAWFRGPKAMTNDIRHVYVDARNDETRLYDMVLQTGVDIVCCNRPNLVLDLLQQQKQQQQQRQSPKELDDSDEEEPVLEPEQ